jgi:hypothetical protein
MIPAPYDGESVSSTGLGIYDMVETTDLCGLSKESDYKLEVLLDTTHQEVNYATKDS